VPALPHENRIRIITFAEIDNELKLPSGSTQKYLKDIVVSMWSYKLAQEGKNTILFQYSPTIATVPRRTSIWDGY